MERNIFVPCCIHMAKARPDKAAKAANATSIPARRGKGRARRVFIAAI